MANAGRITALIDGDISALTNKLNQARSQSAAAASGIESDFKSKVGSGLGDSMSGLAGSLTGGKWSKAGKEIGESLVSGITAPLGSMGGAAAQVATALGPTGIVASAAVAGTAIVVSAASRSAMEWEAGMSQISKTTGIKKGSEDFEELNSGLKELYSTMPTTRAEIQSVAAAAGSLGIEKASIAGFTEVALQMGSAFDMPAEEVAISMGKIKGQIKSLPEGVKDSTQFATQMGSAIDYVGNNFNATEKDVLDFATRTSGSLSALGGNAYEIAGWGGMLSSVFPSAERAAGSFDALLTQLTTNTDSQTAAAELLGVSTEDFMSAMTTDPSGTLLNIGSALEGLPTDKLMEVSKNLGGAYGMDVLTKMVGHTDEWGAAIKDTVAAGQQGTSIGESFAAGSNTSKAAFQELRNSVDAILGDIGGPINAAITPIVSGLASGFNKVRTIGENLWEPFTTALTPATEAVSLLAGGIGDVISLPLDTLVSASEGVNTAFKVGKAFVTAFGEEITDVITSSSTFQTISGYIEDVSSAFSSLSETASGIFDDVVSGLSDAIPEAAAGAAEAIGTLLDKAGLGSITEAAGDIGGFFGDVYDNAAEKLGWSVEDGTEEGMEKGAEKAQSTIESTVRTAAEKGTASGLDTAYWSWVEQLQSQGVQTGEALSAKAGETSESHNYNWKNNVWTKTATVAGVEVGIHHDVSAQGSKYTLKINGKDTGISRTTDNYTKTPTVDLVTSMLEEAGLSTDTGTALDLANKPLAAAQWRLSQETDISLDRYINFSDNLKEVMSGAGEAISSDLEENMIPDVSTIDSNLDAIRRLKLYDPDEAERQGADNAINYLESIKDTIESIDAAKAKLLIDPDDNNAQRELDSSIERLQLIADNNPLTVKVEADTTDLYSAVWDALMGGDTDLTKLGVSDPERYFTYAKKELQSSISQYAEAGLAVPMYDAEGKVTEIGTQLLALQTAFHKNYSELDTVNKQSSYLLDEAIAKGGSYWDDLYSHMGLLNDDLSSTASSVSTAATKTESASTNLFNSADYVSTKLDSSGNKFLAIGDSAKSGGVTGGAAVASGGQTAANYLISGASSAADKLRYSTLSSGGILDAGNIFGSVSKKSVSSGAVTYPLADAKTTTTKSSVSGLEGWGSYPKGWTEAMNNAGTATEKASTKTDSLSSSTNTLSSSANSASAAVSDLSSSLSSLSNIYYPLYSGSSGGTVSSGGSGTYTFTDCMFEGFTDECTNMAINSLKYTNPAGQTYEINPMTYIDNGGISKYYQPATSKSYTVPALPEIFRSARGSVFSRAAVTAIAETGTEMVLPPAITQTILDMVGNTKNPSGPNVSINSPIYMSGGSSEGDFDAILARRNKEIIQQVTELIAEASKGR